MNGYQREVLQKCHTLLIRWQLHSMLFKVSAILLLLKDSYCLAQNLLSVFVVQFFKPSNLEHDSAWEFFEKVRRNDPRCVTNMHLYSDTLYVRVSGVTLVFFILVERIDLVKRSFEGIFRILSGTFFWKIIRRNILHFIRNFCRVYAPSSQLWLTIFI